MKKISKYILTLIVILIAGFLGNQVNAQEASETEITFSPKYDFNMASTSRISAIDLSSSKFITVYQDGGNLNYGTAIIGNVSDNIIDYSLENVFNAANTNYLSVAILSDNKFVIVYQDIGNSNYGTAIIGDISGNTITYGSEYVFNTGNTINASIVALSESKFVIVYKDISNSNYGTSIIGDISENTITYSSEYVFNTGNTDYFSIATLSGSKFVVAYKDISNSNYGTSIIGNVSENTITYGSEYVFNQSITNYVSLGFLPDDKFVVAYRDGGNADYGMALIGDVSENVIFYGSEYIFNTGATSYLSLDILGENKFIVSYQGNSGLNYGKTIIGVVSDSVINFGPKYIFNPTSTGCNSVVGLSDNKFVITYQDRGGDLNYGRAIVGSIPVEEVIEPDPQPIPEPEPEPDPVPEPKAEPAIDTTIVDGDLIRNPSAKGIASLDIYIVKIVGTKKFKRLILSPHVFESYEHLNWEDVKDVNQETMDVHAISNLIRAVGNDKVYELFPSGDTGTRKWLNITAEEFVNQGYDSDSIYEINTTDRNAYEK